MDPNNLFLFSIITSIVSVMGAIFNIVIPLLKLKPEKKKLNAETESEIAEAADSIVSGAKISNELLIQQMQRMENREKAREEKYTQRELEYKELVNRFDMLEAELLAWKDYAYRLSHQVQSLGHEPVPFKPETKSLLRP